VRKVERTLADCQRKLARHRAALDAGADLATVTEWINHATAERAGAEAKRAQLRAATPVTATKDQPR
jgi:site-specific DNA recombinase